MRYNMNPKEVRKVIDKILNGDEFDKDKLMYYHLNRNEFNVKTEVKKLTHKDGNRFIDNLGHIWEEQGIIKNFFHMPKANYVGSILGLSKPYSRKFLRDDNASGLGGEFEMIIRHDGKRIDAITNPVFQETYNFGRTRNSREHYALDVATHRENANYTYWRDMGEVKIIESEK